MLLSVSPESTSVTDSSICNLFKNTYSRYLLLKYASWFWYYMLAIAFSIFLLPCKIFYWSFRASFVPQFYFKNKIVMSLDCQGRKLRSYANSKFLCDHKSTPLWSYDFITYCNLFLSYFFSSSKEVYVHALTSLCLEKSCYC